MTERAIREAMGSVTFEDISVIILYFEGSENIDSSPIDGYFKPIDVLIEVRLRFGGKCADFQLIAFVCS
jgi:hypothetical protein